jgi:IS605 OrfB family transposase
MRADIWRRYGALGTVGRSSIDIRKEISAARMYNALPVDGTIRNETTKDAVNDVYLYRAAAMKKVRKAITTRTDDEKECKRLYALLREGEWQDDKFLHRLMRKHFRHGVSHTSNQFIVRSDRFSTEIVDGFLTINIKIARKYGADIRLTTTSSGKNVKLSAKNIRIVVKDGYTEIHYAADKAEGRPHGDKMIGVDKGYSEAFTDSDGTAHGSDFGAVMTTYSNKTHKTGIARNKLYALEKKHRKAGRDSKADNIRINNLGRAKIDRRKEATHKHLATLAHKSAHSIVDKAAVVVSEDLTAQIAKKHVWRRYNRRMSAWAKGILAKAMDSVCTQRGAEHCLVNAAYTSQMDSVTGLLKGKRVGDKFHRENGDVLHADHNAALNVLHRYSDTEITLYTPYKEVKRILIARYPAQLSVNGHELQVMSTYQPCADKP